MKNPDSNLTDEQWARLEALENSPEDQIDTSDIPETADWSKARRGMFHRPDEIAPTPTRNPAPTDTSEKGLEVPDHHFPDQQRVAPWRPAGLRTRPLRRPQPPLRLPSGHPAGDRPSTQPGLRQQHPAPVPGPPQTGDHQSGHHRRSPKRYSAPPASDNPLLRDTQRRQLPSPGTP